MAQLGEVTYRLEAEEGSTETFDEIRRVSKRLSNHARLVSQDIAQLQALFAEVGINFTLVPNEGTIQDGREQIK